jgi:hypothetical protein
MRLCAYWKHRERSAMLVERLQVCRWWHGHRRLCRTCCHGVLLLLRSVLVLTSTSYLDRILAEESAKVHIRCTRFR